MIPKILLVNPPIYDFAAYDFWLKPYGLLSIAGYLRNKAVLYFFDYLDRLYPFAAKQSRLKSDRWGRGRFYCEQISLPSCLGKIPRYFRRFGLPRNIFKDFLRQTQPCDFVLIQTTMTYWYQGVQEVIDDIRKAWPSAKIILGGSYVTLCTSHAEKLGADFLVKGTDLQPLWEYLDIKPDLKQPALWQAYERLNVGTLKLTDGCPFNCTYCSIPKVYGKFKARPLERSLAELELLANRPVDNIAFYDDALLFEAENVLVPFLNEVIDRDIKVNFHTPNGLNARFITPQLAELMVRASFKTFYLGFESICSQWQKRTGSKVSCDELAQAAEHLTAAVRRTPYGRAEPTGITAYTILGHPHNSAEQVEHSIRFVNSLGIRGTLADFSPTPGTPDGEYCRRYVDMDEPLFQNKTAFPIILLGFDETNRLKDLQRKLNRNLAPGL